MEKAFVESETKEDQVSAEALAEAGAEASAVEEEAGAGASPEGEVPPEEETEVASAKAEEIHVEEVVKSNGTELPVSLAGSVHDAVEGRDDKMVNTHAISALNMDTISARIAELKSKLVKVHQEISALESVVANHSSSINMQSRTSFWGRLLSFFRFVRKK